MIDLNNHHQILNVVKYNYVKAIRLQSLRRYVLFLMWSTSPLVETDNNRPPRMIVFNLSARCRILTRDTSLLLAQIRLF